MHSVLKQASVPVWSPILLAFVLSDVASAQKPCDPVSVLVATTPSPPRTEASWKRHDASLARLPGHQGILLIGDSITQAWPSDMLASIFPGRAIVNLGVAGDQVQHVLWRLERAQSVPASPSGVLMMIGTNNVGARTRACGTARGVHDAIVKARALWPKAWIAVISIPPARNEKLVPPDLSDETNQEIQISFTGNRIEAVRYIAFDSFNKEESDFQADGIHLSRIGYKKISEIIKKDLDGWLK